MKRAEFQFLIKNFYNQHARRSLVWRQDITPYRILVSEVMLQQTQVSRVEEKFSAWMSKWPTEARLASAKLSEVLVVWQGLGYNNRAKRLWEASLVVATKGWPTSRAELEALPGVGPYTSGAIMAFAYDKPVVFLDTNIRRVILHHFFVDQSDVSDKQVKEKLAEVLPSNWSARHWYWALMDYGAHLGITLRANNPNRRSRSYTKQSKFEGSLRQVRGAVLRMLSRGSVAAPTLWSLVEADLVRSVDTKQRQAALSGLIRDGLILKDKQVISLQE